MEPITILPGAHPFYYAGGSPACLLIHGLTGTPFEVRWLGQDLNAQGYTVYGPRLAGHGTSAEQLARVHWQEWYSDVLAAYEMLRAEGKPVVVIGISMGGVLATLLAAQRPVAGLVALATPVEFEDRRRPLVPLLSHVIDTLPKGYDEDDEAAFDARVRAEQERRGEPVTGHPSYDEWVVPAVNQFLKMIEVMRAEAPAVTAPALLVHSKGDRTVPYDNMARLSALLSQSPHRTVTLEQGGHVVTEDVEMAQVTRAVLDFVASLG